MTTPPSLRPAWYTAPVLLWSAFVIVHFVLGLLNLRAPGYPLGDVSSVYTFWTDQAIVGHYWVGINGPWVYPILAIVPMLAARMFGMSEYSGVWLAMIMVLDAIAFAVIVGWGKRRQNSLVAWWWLGFLLLLGPIALGRIDSVTVPLAIVGVLLVASRPRLAAFILTIATWIKVWPAAIIVAIVISVRERAAVVVTGLITSVLIIAGALALGSGTNVFSFVTEQTGRGLQVEAPIATIWLWGATAGTGTTVYYDTDLLTWQVRGAGVDVASAVTTPLMLLAFLVVAALGALAVRSRARVADILPALSLGFVAAFIAFNKVGSPQYITWFAVPVILGLATTAAGSGRSFRVPAILSAVLAALTQVIYPYLYGYLLSLNPLMLTVITAKDLLLFVLLGWSMWALWREWRRTNASAAENPEWLPEVWPFSALPPEVIPNK
ncbi:glycosyltransferase 87 family protein [Lacisediminihabitans changchengi]|uniref:DUF2029 domain-containing protein n=1 Tax=Lacisediminihabitans changchengi TaxID=2787634 RepID=A0A934W4F3_9MICO|nr:glycosyltransferase 87 family protein [Lacisediminihabitans changchengi]MBK4347430.1 DUF2029 domain-containing protein [Lacisediminihabitans changchengi]